MPLPQWPSPSFGGGTIPEGIPIGARRGVEDEGKIVSEFDVGLPHTRPRYTAVIETLDWIDDRYDTDAKVKELLAFHDATLKFGTLTFNWEVPETPVSLREFQFRARPTYAWIDKRQQWRITVALRILP